MSLAVIDISPLRNGGDTQSVARQIGETCRSIGFFYATGHGVDERLIEHVYRQAAAFHALPQVEKERYHIALSPVTTEVTFRRARRITAQSLAPV
ncbi:MAG: 2-oxoglutarate and iron-dependent oxygenase domain-containing protein [Gammaproteobacteria bacterium]